MLGVMWIVFSHTSGGVAAPLYLLVGIVTVGFFLTATRYLMTLFHTNRSVLLDSTVPRETRSRRTWSHVYKFGTSCSASRSRRTTSSSRGGSGLLAPLVVAYVAFVLGVGFLLAIAHCFTSDVEHVWMISRLLFFATPVFYTLDSLGPVAQLAVYQLGPPFVSRSGTCSGRRARSIRWSTPTPLPSGLPPSWWATGVPPVESLAVERA
jgi:ABC-type polysaccharide/polyol phosphate export permease